MLVLFSFSCGNVLHVASGGSVWLTEPAGSADVYLGVLVSLRIGVYNDERTHAQEKPENTRMHARAKACTICA